MASVLKRRLKGKATALYAKVKRGGQWTQAATSQSSRPLAFAWATVRCECGACVRARSGAPALPLGELPLAPVVPVPTRHTVGELMVKWSASLTNRSMSDDRSRINKHVQPAFAHRYVEEIALPDVMNWIDAQRQVIEPVKPKQIGGRRKNPDGRLSDATIRHNLNLLSRFFSWAIERGHATVNPVRQIPVGKRPQQAPKKDEPWIDDDAVTRHVFHELPEPVSLMFICGNQCGMRPGETRGLRLSDLAFLVDGVIRARYSDDGPLKEDKRSEGKAKWVPASEDAATLLGSWLAQREAAGAGPEDYVFPYHSSREALKQFVEGEWRAMRPRLKAKHNIDLGEMTFYQATRHSFTSRNLSRGVSLDEVSAAIGHSSPVVTRRYYDHYVRRSFSEGMRKGLGLAVVESATIHTFKREVGS